MRRIALGAWRSVQNQCAHKFSVPAAGTLLSSSVLLRLLFSQYSHFLILSSFFPAGQLFLSTPPTAVRFSSNFSPIPSSVAAKSRIGPSARKISVNRLTHFPWYYIIEPMNKGVCLLYTSWQGQPSFSKRRRHRPGALTQMVWKNDSPSLYLLSVAKPEDTIAPSARHISGFYHRLPPIGKAFPRSPG